MFTEEQQQAVYKIMLKYNSEESNREELEEKYNTNPMELSIMEIYALEEIFRVGNKSIFKTLLSKKQNENQNIVKEFDMFIDLLKSNSEFKKNEIEKYLNFPKSLSALEEFIISLILQYNNSIEDEKDFEEETIHYEGTLCEFDDFEELKFGNDDEIRESILNIIIGNFIYDAMNNAELLNKDPYLKGIIDRQAEPGMLDNADKPYIISVVKSSLEENRSGIVQKVDDMFTIIKFNIQMGKGKKAFDKYIVQRTNIKNSEIGFKLEPNKTYDDILKQFREAVKRKV